MVIKTKSPVRISFGACGDTDYYMDLIGWGNVVNATINMYSYCEIHKRADKKIVLRSLETSNTLEFNSPDEIEFGERELNIMKAVAKHFGNTGIEVITYTDVPLESGLGGSAAHAISLIKAFDQFNEIKRSKEDTAKLAYDIERKVLGIEGGYQDQYASAFGGINYIEFRKDNISVNPLKFSGRELEQLEKNMVLVYVPRDKESSSTHAEQRKKSREIVPLLEIKRENVLKLRHELESRKFNDIGPILHLDWKIKKQTSPNNISERLDNIYNAAMNAGAEGGRFIGAGAGGAAMFFCPGKREEVLRALEKFGAKELRFSFERHHTEKNYNTAIKERLEEHNNLIEAMMGNEELMEKAHKITNRLVECYRNDGKLVIFGNGGSAADAQHIAAEMVNKFKIDRPMLNAFALTVNTSIITAIANDYSYDDVFSRQIEFLVDSCDVVIGISTSGKAMNVMKALKKAKERGATVVFFTGKDGGTISSICENDGTIDIALKIPHEKTERIQEGHILMGHIICELVENELYGSE